MDHQRLPSRTLILTLPAMTVAEAEKLIDVLNSFSEALWAEYGEAMIDPKILSDARPEDFDDDDEPSF